MIETSLDLGGYPVILSDTAGLRDSEDIIEKEGVQRALQTAKDADIALIMVEIFDVLEAIKQKIRWCEFIRTYLEDVGICNINNDLNDYLWYKEQNIVILVNKIDLLSDDNEFELVKKYIDDKCIQISIKDKLGLNNAINCIVKQCSDICNTGSCDTPTLTSSRHRTHVTKALHELKIVMGKETDGEITINHYSDLLSQDSSILFAAFHLQEAALQLGHITGNITTEEILDHIFSSFCIGK